MTATTAGTCIECGLPESEHCTVCGWCPRSDDGGCECTPVMAGPEIEDNKTYWSETLGRRVTIPEGA